MLAHGSELFEIRVQQNWRFKTQAMGLTFRFAEDVHFATDAGGERHDVRFTQRVDRRVSDLRELLAEVVVNNTRLAGEHGKGYRRPLNRRLRPFSPNTLITESSSSAL